MPELGPIELVIILVIVTMLFGVGKLPELFGAVGRGVREFRQAMNMHDETVSQPVQPVQPVQAVQASEVEPVNSPDAPQAT